MKLRWHTQNGPVDIVPQVVAAGIDFGFSPDPLAFEVGAKWGDVWLNFYELYREKMSIPDIVKELIWATRMFEIQRIWADSSDPKMIQHLQAHGLPVIANQIKEVDFGIRTVYGLMKRQTGNMTLGAGPCFRVLREKCPGLIAEIQKYGYKVSKGDVVGGKPIDRHNHALDCVRYYMTGEGEIPPDVYKPSILDQPVMYVDEKGQWHDNPRAHMARNLVGRQGIDAHTWWDEVEADTDVELIGWDDL